MPDRKILFKAKRLDNGEWVFGFPLYDWADCTMKKQGKCKCAHNGELIAFFAWLDDFHEYDEVEVDPSTVSQYTGMTDKHGIMIFEGDICQVGNLAYQVVFQHSQWWFSIVTPSVYCCPYFDSHCGEHCEIIGNRWDNPEMIGGDQHE